MTLKYRFHHHHHPFTRLFFLRFPEDFLFSWKSLQSRMEAIRLCMLSKLHYGQVVADGMPHLIPMRRASRYLNANAYEVSCSRTIYHEVLVFPMHNKGIKLVSRRHCHSKLLNVDLFKKAPVA